MPDETKSMFDHLGSGAAVLLAVFVVSVVCTALGLRAARKVSRWPHWAALVSGLGRTAFLLGVVMSLTRLYPGFRVIADMRAASTVTEVAGPVADGLALIILGAWASLISLGLAVLLRLRERRPQLA